MTTQYTSPLVERFATAEMARLWSAQRKFSTWRRCWVALAEAEQELGLPISDAQIGEMRAHVDDIDFEAAARYERELRHDVMSHIHVYGLVAPSARPIIHLGATSPDSDAGGLETGPGPLVPGYRAACCLRP